jgi:hypothetical protein
VCFALLALANAHGVHPDEKVEPGDDWALYHMQEEHRTPPYPRPGRPRLLLMRRRHFELRRGVILLPT